MQSERQRQISDTVVITLLGLSRRTFYRFLKDGIITSPVGRLGKNRRGWTSADIEFARMQITQKKEAR